MISDRLKDLGAGIRLPPPRLEGQVSEILGTLISGVAARCAVGDLFRVHGRSGSILAEVVALKDGKAILMPYGPLAGLVVGARMVSEGASFSIPVGERLLGRVIDALGQPLDGQPLLDLESTQPINAQPLSPLERRPVDQPLPLGVKPLDAFIPCGVGQRLGIFAGPGVGKSVLLGMIAKKAKADVVVLALVGERGREVGHFVQQILGDEGMARAVVVAATSDRPAPERLRASLVATAIAEHFRDRGKSVLLFVDSLTRMCMAQREIGLAVGEPPTSRGYPPSVFSMLPQLLERAAPKRTGGSITGIYTVLVEGDDMNEPIADAARGLLDGHIILSRQLAARGQYPAVDVVRSLSRLEGDLAKPETRDAMRRLRGWLAQAEEAQDLVSVGAYRQGADPELDRALTMKPRIEAALRQGEDEEAPAMETLATVHQLAGDAP